MSGERKRKRMTMPKKREDLEKIVEEVEQSHAHEHAHEHHHHHHGDVDEVLAVMELLIDSLNATVKNLEARLNSQATEIARLYKILAYVVQSLAQEDAESRAKILKRAIEVLEKD